MITAADRELALKELDDSRERLLGTLKGLSREELTYRPTPHTWSVAENLEHVILVEKYLLTRLEGLLQWAPDSSKRSQWEGQDETLVRKMRERSKRVQAPEVFHPSGRRPIERLAQEFKAARELSRHFAASTQGDLRSHFFAHPVLGELDGYQWLLMIGAHTDRHTAQAEAVKASPGFRGIAGGVSDGIRTAGMSTKNPPFATPQSNKTVNIAVWCDATQTSNICNTKSKEELL